jgi:large subunit ribosomal protein L22
MANSLQQTAEATTLHVKASTQKLNLVAQLIRGKSAAQAMNLLAFTNKKAAKEVLETVRSAIANAENNHNMDVDRLVVSQAFVGKTMKLKRFSARGRGRSASIMKHFSRVTVILTEQEAA